MKNCRKLISSFIAIAMVICMLALPASASDIRPFASDYIADYGLSIDTSSGGVITVIADVSATGTLAYVGFSTLSIQVYENGIWKNVATYSGFSSRSQVMGQNTSSFANELTYSGQTGKLYRAKGTVYCGQDSSYNNCDTRKDVTSLTITAE